VAKPERKVLTIEDPVEYRVPGISQHQVDPQAGFTFSSALRSFLRADPDVIMVGEVRDAETAEMAVDAAYTGHLVLSSFHASSASLAPLRLVEMGIAPALVGAGLSGILAQRLVRRLCTSCRVPDEADHQVDWPGGRPGQLWAANPRGCQRCAVSGRGGYRGRVAVGELLVVDDKARRVIVAGADPGDLEEALRSQGGVTMWADGLAKVADGVTSMAELARALKKEEHP
jgi:type IV pilus assembly protein PilB